MLRYEEVVFAQNYNVGAVEEEAHEQQRDARLNVPMALLKIVEER